MLGQLQKLWKMAKDIIYRLYIGELTYSYAYLSTHKWNEIFFFKESNMKVYLRRKKAIEHKNIRRLQKQEKVKIAFVVPLLQCWIGDEILKRFMENPRFEVLIIVPTFSNGDQNFTKSEFKRTQSYFANYDVDCLALDEKSDRWDQTGEPDICFYLTPYHDLLPKSIRALETPLKTLNLYTAYGYLLADGLKTWQFDLPIHNLAWKNYIHTEFYRKMGESISSVKGSNMVLSGYPKMDPIYCSDMNFSWKCVSGGSNPLKIIYAPHHSIKDVEPECGTFDQNEMMIYEYARSHPRETTWVFKPHPVLRKTSVEKGYFRSEQEYEDYIKKWDDLPNAQVIEGEYLNCFMTSDCMIHDSISFVAEYLFTGKPVLVLCRENNKLNSFGQEILRVLYKVMGNDWNGIKNFLEKDVFEDKKRDERLAFYSKYLDYKTINGMLASDFIYHDICKELKIREKGKKYENKG